MLPWYTPGKVDSNEDLSRSPKWQKDGENPASREPYVIDAEAKTWSPWRKNQGSDIEQRTEVTDDSQSTTNFDQHAGSSFEYGQFEQQENKKHFPDSDGLEEGKDKGEKQEASKGNDFQTTIKDDQDFYEGVPPDSTVIHSLFSYLHSEF